MTVRGCRTARRRDTVGPTRLRARHGHGILSGAGRIDVRHRTQRATRSQHGPDRGRPPTKERHERPGLPLRPALHQRPRVGPRRRRRSGPHRHHVLRPGRARRRRLRLPPGRRRHASPPGDSCGEVESTKSVSDVYAPLEGEVTATNAALDASPELINSDPYGEGWMFELRLADASARRRAHGRLGLHRVAVLTPTPAASAGCAGQVSDLPGSTRVDGPESARTTEEDRMSSDLPDPDDMNVEPRTMRFQGVPSQDTDHVETADPRGLTRRGPGDDRGAAPRHGAARRAPWPQHGRALPARRPGGGGRAAPRLRHLPRRRHRLAQARALRRAGRRLRRARRRARSTAPTSTASGSTRPPCTRATRSRSASSASSTTRPEPRSTHPHDRRLARH